VLANFLKAQNDKIPRGLYGKDWVTLAYCEKHMSMKDCEREFESGEDQRYMMKRHIRSMHDPHKTRGWTSGGEYGQHYRLFPRAKGAEKLRRNADETPTAGYLGPGFIGCRINPPKISAKHQKTDIMIGT
jgi:hypothetical protein